MKKNIVLFFICTLINCSENNDSQTRDRAVLNESIIMTSESNKWYINGNVEYIDNVNDILETRRRKLLYYFEGDTLINNLQYKKMYYKQFDSIFNQPLSGGLPQFISTFYDVKYIAAMRQDTDLVYYVHKNENTEDLYANFNINLGEVLNYKWNYDNDIVTEIDSIEIGSNYITKYKLSNNQYFYEGIGASYGLFNGWQINANVGGFLVCFESGNHKIEIDEGFYSPINYCPEF